jgi:hypothetical protein
MSFDYKEWKKQQYSATNDTPKPAISCPTAIYVSAVIWIAVGLIQWMIFILFFLQSQRFGYPVGLIFLGLIHVCCGLRTLSGTATGTVGSGIFSLVYGFVWVGFVAMTAKSATSPDAPLILFGVGIVGVALLLAGCLAMFASASYQRWHNSP